MKLLYTRQAAAELDRLLTYLAEQSPHGARNVLTRVQAVTTVLLEQPRAGRPTNRKGLRRIPATPYPYLIYYEAKGEEIIVHGIRHGARRPSSLFGEL